MYIPCQRKTHDIFSFKTPQLSQFTQFRNKTTHPIYTTLSQIDSGFLVGGVPSPGDNGRLLNLCLWFLESSSRMSPVHCHPISPDSVLNQGWPIGDKRAACVPPVHLFAAARAFFHRTKEVLPPLKKRRRILSKENFTKIAY
jgi:hypothetical protein